MSDPNQPADERAQPEQPQAAPQPEQQQGQPEQPEAQQPQTEQQPPAQQPQTEQQPPAQQPQFEQEPQAQQPQFEQQQPYAQPQTGQPQYAQPQPGHPQGNPYATPAAEKKKPAVPHWVWWVLGGAVAFAVLAVVAVVLIVNLGGNNGAKSVAQDYLNDIAKGKASAANTLARVDAEDDRNFLLTDKVLSQADRITAPAVNRVISSRSSDLTQVTVTYKLAGKSYRGTMELDKDGKGWYISRGLTYAVPYVSSTIPGFSVPGAERPITSKDSETNAYPAVYSIQTPNKYYELKGSPKLTIAADSYQVKDLKLTPSQAYLSEVQKQVDAHYAQCAAKTSYYDVEDCGIELSYPDNLPTSSSTVAVKVDESPKVTISDDADSYYQFKIGAGKFSGTISGTDFSGNPATEPLSGQAGYISADIKVDGDKVVVTFN